jgi:D-sedoheptulose 7-phosphate isomerase
MSLFHGIFDTHLQGHLLAVQSLESQRASLTAIAEAWLKALRAGRKILFFGNGGSAADAQHLAAELVVRYQRNRRALPALALTCDSSILTAHSNDFGFESLFARQIEALAQPGDVVVGISTSGKSANVLAGLKAAKAGQCVTVAFCGSQGGPCLELADLNFQAPSELTAHVQECHLMAGHILCGFIEEALAQSEL